METLKYKCSQSQKPLFGVTQPQPPTPHQYRSFTPNHTIIDASFSAYLKPEDNNNNHVMTEEPEINVFDAKKYFSESNDMKEIKQLSQSNNKLSCDVAAIPRLSSVSSVDGGGGGYGRNFRANSFHATPTASSEASWNSQTGLLSNPPGAIAVSLRSIPNDHRGKRRGSSGRKWFFCRKCPCSGKKSIQVEEESSDTISNCTNQSAVKSNLYDKKQRHRVSTERVEEIISNLSQKSSVQRSSLNSNTEHTQRHSIESHVTPNSTTAIACQQRVSASGRTFTDTTTGGFSFPILNTSNQGKLGFRAPPPPPPPQTRSNIQPLEDPARDSLEVFQPISRKSIEDRSFPFPGSPMSRITGTDDDAASDASSDLFEIESFSTSTHTTSYPMYRRRDSLDEATTFSSQRISTANNGGLYGGRRSLDEPGTPSVAATECYAPSEVSIDWSVTTAEGYDRASVTNFSISASEFGDVTNMRLRNVNGGGRGGGEGQLEGAAGKWKGGGLLSCRHEKAVSVGPQPVRCLPEGPQLPLISTTGHVSSRPPRAVMNNNKLPPIASSHSARLSLAFAA